MGSFSWTPTSPVSPVVPWDFPFRPPVGKCSLLQLCHIWKQAVGKQRDKKSNSKWFCSHGHSFIKQRLRAPLQEYWFLTASLLPLLLPPHDCLRAGMREKRNKGGNGGLSPFSHFSNKNERASPGTLWRYYSHHFHVSKRIKFRLGNGVGGVGNSPLVCWILKFWCFSLIFLQLFTLQYSQTAVSWILSRFYDCVQWWTKSSKYLTILPRTII